MAAVGKQRVDRAVYDVMLPEGVEVEVPPLAHGQHVGVRGGLLHLLHGAGLREHEVALDGAEAVEDKLHYLHVGANLYALHLRVAPVIDAGAHAGEHGVDECSDLEPTLCLQQSFRDKPLQEGYKSFGRVVGLAAQGTLGYLGHGAQGAQQVAVGQLRQVACLYYVGKGRHGGKPLGIVPDGADAVGHLLHRGPAQCVPYLDVHLRGEVDLPRHLDYAAVAVPRLRKVFRALETHPAPYVEVGAGLFHPHMVGGCLEYRYVYGVFGVEGIDGVLELLLGKRVVFVRHPYVPEYVAVSRLRNERVVGELGVIIREYRDYLELPCGAVVVCLKIVCPVVVVPESGKLAPFLEAHTLDKA